eukprot:5848147-Pyramimonas_sp.AAC.1
MAVVRKAKDLPDMISETVLVIRATANRYGMAITFKKGKSAILVLPRGIGSKPIKTQLFPTTDPLHEPQYGDILYIQRTYKYLGTMVTQNGCLAPELFYRRTQQQIGDRSWTAQEDCSQGQAPQ